MLGNEDGDDDKLERAFISEESSNAICHVRKECIRSDSYEATGEASMQRMPLCSAHARRGGGCLTRPSDVSMN